MTDIDKLTKEELNAIEKTHTQCHGCIRGCPNHCSKCGLSSSWPCRELVLIAMARSGLNLASELEAARKVVAALRGALQGMVDNNTRSTYQEAVAVLNTVPESWPESEYDQMVRENQELNERLELAKRVVDATRAEHQAMLREEQAMSDLEGPTWGMRVEETLTARRMKIAELAAYDRVMEEQR